MNKLVKGKIPAGQPCPFFNRCKYAQSNCPNDKLLKESPFSCKQARRFDALEEASKIDWSKVKPLVSVDLSYFQTMLPVPTEEKSDLIDSLAGSIKHLSNIEPIIEKANLAGGNVSMSDVERLANQNKNKSSLQIEFVEDVTEALNSIWCCINFAGNENDHTFWRLVGHHPNCPKLKGITDRLNLKERVDAIFEKSDGIIAKQKEEIKDLKAELKNSEEVRNKMADILDAISNILSSASQKLVRYSWHDLAEVAKKKIKKD